MARIDAQDNPYPGSVRFVDVTLSFRELPVLAGINLEIKRELLCLLGPSGCGKSTLLRLIAQLLQPDQGQVLLHPEHRIGFVFQDAQLLPWRNIAANVALPLELEGQKQATALQKARAALDAVGLSAAEKDYPNQLSGGMKMRVSIARALVTEPNLLLMDEPFAALDEPTRHGLQQSLLQLKTARPMTIVFVTHSVAEAVFLADRVVLLGNRPASILATCPVALEEPRTRETRTSAAYNQIVRKLDQLLLEQLEPQLNLGLPR